MPPPFRQRRSLLVLAVAAALGGTAATPPPPPPAHGMFIGEPIWHAALHGGAPRPEFVFFRKTFALPAAPGTRVVSAELQVSTTCRDRAPPCALPGPWIRRAGHTRWPSRAAPRPFAGAGKGGRAH